MASRLLAAKPDDPDADNNLSMENDSTNNNDQIMLVKVIGKIV